MARNPFRISWDYNRGLDPVVRFAHVLFVPLALIICPIWNWILDHRRRRWTLPLALGLIAALIVYPFDNFLSHAARSVHLGGDLKRELEALQQFGGLGLSLIIALVIWAMDPANRRRLLDWGFALAVNGLVLLVIKMVVGRPRPKFDDPTTFLGPFGAYPMGAEHGVVHAWEVGKGIGSDLWSMPSSHTAAAVVAAVFLTRLYSKLAGVMIVLVAIVGISRVVLGAHYPSDVFVGMAVAFVIADHAVGGFWGVRVLDFVWIRFVDRSASPAFLKMKQANSE